MGTPDPGDDETTAYTEPSDVQSSANPTVTGVDQPGEVLNTLACNASCTHFETEAAAVLAGDMVYFVKDNPELTIPVFYSQLVQMKGSDASWVNDTEPPPEVIRIFENAFVFHRRFYAGLNIILFCLFRPFTAVFPLCFFSLHFLLLSLLVSVIF